MIDLKKHVIYFDMDNPEEDYLYNSIQTFIQQKTECSLLGIYPILVYMKYIIEKNNMNYQEILAGDVDELFSILEEDFSNFLSVITAIKGIKEEKLYEVLKYMAFEDYHIPIYKDQVLHHYIKEDKKYVLIVRDRFDEVPYIPEENVSVYTRKFITPVNNRFSRRFLEYFVYDRVLGNHRKIFTSIDELNKDEIDEYIFINNQSSFLDCKEFIRSNYLKSTRIMFAIDKYKNISSLNSNKTLLRDIESIIILNDKVYFKYNLFYNRANYKNSINNPICIKDLTHLTDYNSLSDVIDGKEDIKGVCVNVTIEDIINHHYRIGVSTYENDGDNKLLVLVDRSKALTNRIHRLDDEIAYKIDELIVR